VLFRSILQLESQLGERGVTISLQPQARAWLAKRGYDPLYGARPLGRLIQEKVKKPLAEELLFGALQKGGAVTVGLDEAGDKLTFDVHATGTSVVKAEPKSEHKQDETVEGR
jgi:ATP-dependent Clp protease ATP-binding subunit ClpA